MSSSASTLPVGWSQILDQVQMRLDHAIALADARVVQVPHSDGETLGRAAAQGIAQWNERLQRLHGYLDSVEQIVQSVDESLQSEEANLRQQLANSVMLRQRLANDVGRAIG